jgi:solute:Na+ symporter, SSS family
MDITVLSVVAVYFVFSLGLGFWVARKEKNKTDDYFLAGRKLPWYAVSLSMTGSNIGTEHFIGMVGTAYVFGLAPATFEWGNFIPYSLLIWIFLPYFFRKKLYTVPQFLERRYGASTRSMFALFTLFHMVFVVLTSALYAGGRILYEMSGEPPIEAFNWSYMGCVILIAATTAAYCTYGGLLSVVWTDVLQVAILLIGGLTLIIIGSNHVGGIKEVIDINLAADPDRFSLILPASHKVSPWTGVFTFWLTLSLWYVGTNQFYIQRCLGAKSEWDAKMGVLGCAYLKILLPFIIVFPGMVAFAKFGPGLAEDAVYVKMINEFLPPVGQGLLLAALVAAIMSTVSSVLNSSATIWSVDVHKRFIRKDASEEEMVRVARIATLVAILIGTVTAPLLIYYKGGIFIYIQDIAAFLAPPISVIFLAAFLWKGAHSRAATFTLPFGIVSGILLMVLGRVNPDVTMFGHKIPFENLQPLLNRAAVNWVICAVVMVLVNFLVPRKEEETYDPDIIWNPKWAELPESECALNRGGRSLMLWWVVLVVLSAGLFVYFR